MGGAISGTLREDNGSDKLIPESCMKINEIMKGSDLSASGGFIRLEGSCKIQMIL